MFTIGTLAREGGVGVETVRYYQRRGLLDTPQRGGGVRRYGETDLRRLRFIRAAQAAGFTLEAIGELLTLYAGHDRARAPDIRYFHVTPTRSCPAASTYNRRPPG